MKRHVIIALIVLFAFWLGGFVGIRVAPPIYIEVPVYQTPSPVIFPTGQDVLEELQEYRVSEGLEEFQLSPTLCNNIAERWKAYRENDSHDGLSEFHDKWMPQVYDLGEIMVSGETSKEMVEKWASSPSHDVLIKKYSKICVYSAFGSSVALLSN